MLIYGIRFGRFTRTVARFALKRRPEKIELSIACYGDDNNSWLSPRLSSKHTVCRSGSPAVLKTTPSSEHVYMWRSRQMSDEAYSVQLYKTNRKKVARFSGKLVICSNNYNRSRETGVVNNSIWAHREFTSKRVRVSSNRNNVSAVKTNGLLIINLPLRKENICKNYKWNRIKYFWNVISNKVMFF